VISFEIWCGKLSCQYLDCLCPKLHNSENRLDHDRRPCPVAVVDRAARGMLVCVHTLRLAPEATSLTPEVRCSARSALVNATLAKSRSNALVNVARSWLPACRDCRLGTCIEQGTCRSVERIHFNAFRIGSTSSETTGQRLLRRATPTSRDWYRNYMQLT